MNYVHFLYIRQTYLHSMKDHWHGSMPFIQFNSKMSQWNLSLYLPAVWPTYATFFFWIRWPGPKSLEGFHYLRSIMYKNIQLVAASPLNHSFALSTLTLITKHFAWVLFLNVRVILQYQKPIINHFPLQVFFTCSQYFAQRKLTKA